MTITEIETKIAERNQWLKDNPDHHSRPLVQSDIRDLEWKLSQMKPPPWHDIEVNDPEVMNHEIPRAHNERDS